MTAAKQLQFEASEDTLILIADDHYVTAEIEKVYLTGVGYRVVVATTESELESSVRALRPKLIIIDSGFGSNDALRFVQRTKANQALKETKIMVTSVQSAPAIRRKFEQAGADQFIVKPAPRQKILREIKKMTDHQVRDVERVKQKLIMQYEFDDHIKSAWTLDVSSDGAHLECDIHSSKPKLGTKVALKLQLKEDDHLLKIGGTIVRHTKEGIGVKFDEMSQTVRRTLDKYLLLYSSEHKASQYYL